MKLQEILRASAQQHAPGSTNEHYSIEHLRAYHLGMLTPDEAASIRGHLVFCRPCRDDLLDFIDFLDCIAEVKALDDSDATSELSQLLRPPSASALVESLRSKLREDQARASSYNSKLPKN